MFMRMIMDVFTIVVMVTSITIYDHVDYGNGAILASPKSSNTMDPHVTTTLHQKNKRPI
jgi:hypothetical protein